jgi:nitroreductase
LIGIKDLFMGLVLAFTTILSQDSEMLTFSRRWFVASTAVAGIMLSNLSTSIGLAKFPAPRLKGGMPLMQAFAARRSTRTYADRKIDEDMLSSLLWAAFGINRPESGGHTAPSWRTSNETDIYVADSNGVAKYDPADQSLKSVLETDIRAKVSPQPFVGTASMVLIYVGDRARMAKAPDADQIQATHVDSAVIAENVYLFCASEGLGTCLVGGIDKKGVAALLHLPESQIVTFAQPVGYPKTD